MKQENLSNKAIVLYEDKDITLEYFPIKKEYRVTIFKNCHWHGELVFSQDALLYDELSEKE